MRHEIHTHLRMNKRYVYASIHDEVLKTGIAILLLTIITFHSRRRIEQWEMYFELKHYSFHYRIETIL